MATKAKAKAGAAGRESGGFVRMRVTEAEARLIRARRDAEPSDRPQVISGYREPRNAAELIEVFRAFVEANWATVAGASMDSSEFDVDTRDDGTVTVRAGKAGTLPDLLAPDEVEALERHRAARRAAAAEPEFRATLDASRNLTKDGKAKYESVAIDVRILRRDAWSELQARDLNEWAGVAIEDGRILAVRLAPPSGPGRPWSPWGANDVASAEERESLLNVRRLLWAALERSPDVDCLGLEAGKNGESRITLRAEPGKLSVAVDVRDAGWL